MKLFRKQFFPLTPKSPAGTLVHLNAYQGSTIYSRTLSINVSICRLNPMPQSAHCWSKLYYYIRTKHLQDIFHGGSSGKPKLAIKSRNFKANLAAKICLTKSSFMKYFTFCCIVVALMKLSRSITKIKLHVWNISSVLILIKLEVSQSFRSSQMHLEEPQCLISSLRYQTLHTHTRSRSFFCSSVIVYFTKHFSTVRYFFRKSQIQTKPRLASPWRAGSPRSVGCCHVQVLDRAVGCVLFSSAQVWHHLRSNKGTLLINASVVTKLEMVPLFFISLRSVCPSRSIYR